MFLGVVVVLIAQMTQALCEVFLVTVVFWTLVVGVAAARALVIRPCFQIVVTPVVDMLLFLGCEVIHSLNSGSCRLNSAICQLLFFNVRGVFRGVVFCSVSHHRFRPPVRVTSPPCLYLLRRPSYWLRSLATAAVVQGFYYATQLIIIATYMLCP